MFQISVLISKPFEKVQIRDKKVYGNYEVSLLTFMFPKLNNFFATFGRFSNKHRILLFRSSIYPRFFKVGILQTLKVQKWTSLFSECVLYLSLASISIGPLPFLKKVKITELYTLYVVFTRGQIAVALWNRNMYVWFYGFPCIACPVQSRLSVSTEPSGIVLHLRIFAFWTLVKITVECGCQSP